MSLLFGHPACLALLPLAALPWLRRRRAASGYSWLALLPRDAVSEAFHAALKLLATVAIGSCVLGLAGPYVPPAPIEHVGRGAQILILLDRSRSMDELFAGAHESKAAVACSLLAEFARQRDHDLIGMLAFTTIPIRIIGFTPKMELVQAAIRAGAEGRGLAETDVGLALLAALAQFEYQPYNGSRVILLVSDGGAQLDLDTQERIAHAMKREHVALYWLYLRTRRSPGLMADRDVAPESQDQVPEHFLHAFFGTMGAPYHAYEAEDPNALQRAIGDIDRLEQLWMRYRVSAGPHDLAGTAYGAALASAVLLLIASLGERRP